MDIQKDHQIYEIGKLHEMVGKAMQEIADIRRFAKDFDLLNSQVYIEFEDALNKISVMDPNE